MALHPLTGNPVISAWIETDSCDEYDSSVILLTKDQAADEWGKTLVSDCASNVLTKNWRNNIVISPLSFSRYVALNYADDQEGTNPANGVAVQNIFDCNAGAGQESGEPQAADVSLVASVLVLLVVAGAWCRNAPRG